MTNKKIMAFDSFMPIYKVMMWAGYYKLLEPTTRFKHVCHQIYRPMAFLLVILTILQYGLNIPATYHDMNMRLDVARLLVTILNLAVKFLVINWNSSRLDRINELIKDPIFAAIDEYDEELVGANNHQILRLFNAVNIGTTLCTVLWIILACINRMRNPNAVLPVYTPFKVDTWSRYALALFTQVGHIFWVGYGHFAMDLLTIAYYAQARVQLQIINHNFKNICKTHEMKQSNNKKTLCHRDNINMNIEKRLIYFIQRYYKVVWYTREVNFIFNASVSFQMLSTCLLICTIIFLISTVSNKLSLEFAYAVSYISMIGFQVFLYCYYGGLVRYESDLVSDALYQSDWLSVPPGLRRTMLMVMCGCSIPITLQVAGIVPLSLTSFIQMVRSAYALYTILISTK